MSLYSVVYLLYLGRTMWTLGWSSSIHTQASHVHRLKVRADIKVIKDAQKYIYIMVCTVIQIQYPWPLPRPLPLTHVVAKTAFFVHVV